MLAAITVLPTAVPLSHRLETAEDAIGLRHASRAAQIAARLHQDDPLPPGTAQQLEVRHISVSTLDGRMVHREGPALPPAIAENACRSATPQMLYAGDGVRWATACVRDHNQLFIAAYTPEVPQSWRQVIYLVFLLAVIVGIVTALGVLRILSPLSRIKGALERVSAGDRGVTVAETGFVELDDLVARVNSAARAMEDREDAILARIKVVQEMARLVAHEVRNPLQSLAMLTSLIALEESLDERQQLADSIHHEIRSLDKVVTRLLKRGSKSGSLRLHTARRAVRPLIEQVVALQTPEATSRGVTLTAEGMLDSLAQIDSALLGRSIENLVLNALQAVQTRRGRVRVSMFEEGEYLGIIVDDNGPGVPQHIADQVFEADVTGGHGTGLGLRLVKGVIEAHGGYIEHRNSPLGGARFVARIRKEL